MFEKLDKEDASRFFDTNIGTYMTPDMKMQAPEFGTQNNWIDDSQG